ncbi:hypothetical protein PHJA_001260200 [Phtheirospermum japonicum]|uniref:Uncharacterized protein n=1 Tax=Phtheirospermum japonicum TaxID=374723 RepID=A0A830BZ40_9LAMI|nr:hypothetical protein PHJA_001260200 [Phtheirospermum japonicum]
MLGPAYGVKSIRSKNDGRNIAPPPGHNFIVDLSKKNEKQITNLNKNKNKDKEISST